MNKNKHCENSSIVQEQNLLPIGLFGGCCLKQDIPRDQVLTYDNVELPAGKATHWLSKMLILFTTKPKQQLVET